MAVTETKTESKTESNTETEIEIENTDRLEGSDRVVGSSALETPDAVPELGLGDAGPYVVELQQQLLDSEFLSAEPDGAFSAHVAVAVRAYQQWHIDRLSRMLEQQPPARLRRSLEELRANLQSEQDRGVAGVWTQQQLAYQEIIPRQVDPDGLPTVPSVSFPSTSIESTDRGEANQVGPDSDHRAVRSLQRALSNAGHPLAIDGDFGPKTARALWQYQRTLLADLDNRLQGPVSETERDQLIQKHNDITVERNAGLAGPRTLASLSVELLGLAEPSDMLKTDPKALLKDVRMNAVFAGKVRLLLKDLLLQGFKPRMSEGYRTYERQQFLYSQGRSRPGRRVTNARGGRSWHQYGLAVDIIHQGPNPWRESPLWAAIGEVCHRHGLYWGGLFGDRPHLEYHPGFSPGDTRQFADIFNDGQATLEELTTVWQQLGLHTPTPTENNENIPA